jgi:hypothetical protein
VVSHACNVDSMTERTEALAAAYARSAPRYDGDDEFDVRKYLASTRAAIKGG